ncbi:DUF5996 family protein [Mucilaginibacter aquaedulcis]|uniref:DUF5996 family protein n=1 Tax=Mucilaginibacter aquaedulcis TaxID=1187081 RepID=UPI0025B4C2C7|nr:DUF5996 family protein [Mucilaginibacter aquaedulcis]MDN3551546.1 DUF5996 family protein [Mucilaginibacter aquaedulcis]
MEAKRNLWPELNYESLKDTLETVQLWTQIVGKIRMANTPWINHSWHVTLYLTSRGLTTGTIPFDQGSFQIDFDFISHELSITLSNGSSALINLQPGSISSFYAHLLRLLNEFGINTNIHAMPSEIAHAIPFDEDHKQRVYIKEEMHNYWQALLRIETAMVRFRAGFNGKSSRAQLFWGAFDLSLSVFSGRRAPQFVGSEPHMPEPVMQESYSHEQFGIGFWPGSKSHPTPLFYGSCYPTTEAFAKQAISPPEAFYSSEMGEFLLRYSDVQKSDEPETMLLDFFKSTYSAAANTGNWNEDLNCDLTPLEHFVRS